MRLDHLLSKGKRVGGRFLLIVEEKKSPVAMRLGATPVPIPNTMVKAQAADGTTLVTVWESRRLPEFLSY